MDSGTYIRFIICLGSGLFGLCTTLSTLFDTLLADWDLIGDLRLWLRHAPHPRSLPTTEWSWERTVRAEAEPPPALQPAGSGWRQIA